MKSKVAKVLTQAQTEAFKQMGVDAFHSGLKAPAQDKEFLPYLKSITPSGQVEFAPFMEAAKIWLDAFVIENLKQSADFEF